MKIVNTHEAKTHLSRLLDEAAAGEEILIAKAGRPIAKLVPYQPARKPRQLGMLRGQIHESPDCWEPDAEIEASIEGPLYTRIGVDPASKVAEEPRP